MTKRALLIGINYRGSSSELNGCINDVKNMKQYLLQNGYKEDDITILTEDTKLKPTRKHIIRALIKLFSCKADQLFLHYSGHGSNVRDVSGDESDGRDETIVPLDYQRSGMITDDQLRGLLDFMSPKSRLTVVLDCCHSGTGLDLCYKAELKKRTVRRPMRRCGWEMHKQKGYHETPGQVVMISGCTDVQYSADAWEKGMFQGAMTYSLLNCLKRKPKTWRELFNSTQTFLTQHGYEQRPNLTSGRPLKLDTQLCFS